MKKCRNLFAYQVEGFTRKWKFLCVYYKLLQMEEIIIVVKFQSLLSLVFFISLFSRETSAHNNTGLNLLEVTFCNLLDLSLCFSLFIHWFCWRIPVHSDAAGTSCGFCTHMEQ